MSKFWLYNPLNLFDKNHILELWPTEGMELELKLNAITRLIILLTILGFALTKSVKIVITSVITLIILVILWKTQYEREQNAKIKETIAKEGFQNISGDDFSNVFKGVFQEPTAKNPLMNVMLTDYKDDPKRKKAAPSYNKNITNKINKNAKYWNKNPYAKKLFEDLGDNLSFEHTMRSFHSMPNTTIPNAQKAFAEFCYGNMPSCKEGDVDACSKINRRIGGIYY